MSKRPQSYAEFQALSRTISEEAHRHGLRFRPELGDIIITPYGKSGTTWLQQIVHSLRTRGDMDFDDISRVIPWLEVSYDLGLDLNAPQKAFPRAFKSHLTWYEVPKGGRYIVSVRDPKDVLVSMFRFMEGWFFAPGSVSISEFATGFLDPGPGRGYWHHLLSWWPQRFREDVLLLVYEEMKEGLPQTIRRVAAFCAIPLDDELLRTTLNQASFDFMLAHKDRFDDRLMRELSERVHGLPSGSDSSKVRQGQSGSHNQELPEGIARSLDQLWHQEIEARLGFPSYEALRREAARERSARQIGE